MSVHHASHHDRPPTSWFGLPSAAEVAGVLALVARFAVGIRAARHPRTTEPAERDENGDATA